MTAMPSADGDKMDLKQGHHDATRELSGPDEMEAVLGLDSALANYIPDTVAEKKMVRKVDLYMIPMLWWMCVLCYVDRNNIVSTTRRSLRLQDRN